MSFGDVLADLGYIFLTSRAEGGRVIFSRDGVNMNTAAACDLLIRVSHNSRNGPLTFDLKMAAPGAHVSTDCATYFW